MKPQLNIGSTERPFFIDPAGITAVHIYPEKKELSLYNEKGQLAWINFDSWGVDAETLVDKLASAGNKLLPFPVRYDGKEYAHFVSPQAVTFATVSQPGKDEGKRGVILGVKGVGREESNGVTADELNDLLTAVKAAGKTLLEYTPDVAHARWSWAEKLYIDPASVTEIRDDGFQVNVNFEASGSLDVQTRTYDGKDNARMNVLLNKLWKERREEFKDLNDCYAEAQRLSDAALAQARLDFADGLAAANGTLTKIENQPRALYVQPEAFAYVTFYNDDRSETSADYKFLMTLQRQKTPDNPYAEGLRAYFNSAADRQASFDALTKPQQKKPAPAPKP